MLKIENTAVFGWEAAIRGMRNPKNSWDRSDSDYRKKLAKTCDDCGKYEFFSDSCDECEIYEISSQLYGYDYAVGPNDHKLMMDLATAGPVHAKFRRMIVVTADITAPLYWWKEFDTYKVGTVANSCSTMHKIHAKEFTLDDFSHEHLLKRTSNRLYDSITELNFWRDIFLNGGEVDNEDGTTRVFQPRDKDVWRQMIQLLPSSYNQRRTVQMNYEVLANIHQYRHNHKLDEWHTFCYWIEELPYSEIILATETSEKKG